MGSKETPDQPLGAGGEAPEKENVWLCMVEAELPELFREIEQNPEREKVRKMLREKLTPRENEIVILHVIKRLLSQYDDSHSKVYAILKLVRPLYVGDVMNVRLEELKCGPNESIDCIEDLDHVLDELAKEYTIEEIY